MGGVSFLLPCFSFVALYRFIRLSYIISNVRKQRVIALKISRDHRTGPTFRCVSLGSNKRCTRRSRLITLQTKTTKKTFPSIQTAIPTFVFSIWILFVCMIQKKVGNSLVEILYHAWVDTHATARDMEPAAVRKLNKRTR